MSEDYRTFIPSDPFWVPTRAQARSAAAAVRSLAPKAQDLEVTLHPSPVFVDAGSNFERLTCPRCGAELDMDWFGAAMSVAYADDAVNLLVDVPCCRASVSLNDLAYEWPQGFARFELRMRDADRDPFSADEIASVAAALGHDVRLIYTHY